MIRHKIYDRLEEQGYSFERILIGPKQAIPRVFSLTNANDWVTVNPTIIVNGSAQISHGPEVTDTTVRLLQELIAELQNPDFADYTSKELVEK